MTNIPSLSAFSALQPQKTSMISHFQKCGKYVANMWQKCGKTDAIHTGLFPPPGLANAGHFVIFVIAAPAPQ